MGAIAAASGQYLTTGHHDDHDTGSHIVASARCMAVVTTCSPTPATLWHFDHPMRDEDATRAAIRPETRLIFGETVGNPGLDVLNIPASPKSLTNGIPLLVDQRYHTYLGTASNERRPYTQLQSS